MITISLQLGHNATVGIMKENKIVGILSQEKVDNVKNSSAFPIEAIKQISNECNIKLEEITDLVISGNYIVPNFLLDTPSSYKIYNEGVFRKYLRFIKSTIVKSPLKDVYYSARHSIVNKTKDETKATILKKLKDNGINIQNIYNVNHHTCHAYSAAYYFEDTTDKRLIFTLDGEGDNISGTVWLKSNNEMKRINFFKVDDSIGHIYTGVTKYLGMTPLEHEYKVMGLSAYTKEKYVKAAYDVLFKDKIRVVEKENGYVIECDFDTTTTEQYLKENAYGIRFDNVAGAVQYVTETIVTEWIEKNIKKFDIHDIAVSGGVFMNVKLNKIIQESNLVNSVKFLPSCGDESNVIGALYYYSKNIAKMNTIPLEEMYMGISYSNDDINKYVENNEIKAKYKIEYYEDINQKVAELLSQRNIVARATGKNEWGARSLGNRAILGHPSFMESFYTINDLIKARDFWMPFAPSILDEDAENYLENFVEEKSYPYSMITAYDTSKNGIEKIRAGIHQGDHSCRPQIVTQKRNEQYYDLLKKFKALTGIGGVVNTSLNIHGYPLAANLEQVFFTFENSGLEYIAIENYLVSKI